MAMAQSGVFGSADAARVGTSTDELTTLARRGEVTRVRRGAYALTSLYEPAHPSERYRLEVLAVLRTRSPEDRASHHSALALLGIDTHGVPARVVAIESRKASRPKTQSGLATHPWSGGDSWVFRSFRTVPPTLACLQVAAKYGFVPGVCAVDSALRKGLLTMPGLEDSIERLPPLRRAFLSSVLAASDDRADSVGESRTRIVLTDAGFEVRSQVSIDDESGFVGRVDLLVDGVVVLEFDGLMKYAGRDGREALAAEKAREERLTRLGYEVVRVTWSDLDDPVALIRRVARARRVALRRRAAMSA
jgi:hypothetical protein